MVGRIGDLLFGLMGQQDPSTQLTQALQPLGGGGTQAAAGAPPATDVAAPGSAPPQGTPAQAQAYTSPPDLSKLYMNLLERTQRNDSLDRGLTNIAAGLTRDTGNRNAIMQNMPNQATPQDPLISATRLMALQQGQQDIARKAAARANLPLISKKYGLDLNTATYLYDTGQLDNIIQDAEKSRLKGDSEKYFGTPIYGQDKDGKLIVGQLANNGSIKWQNSDGTQPVGGIKIVNNGTNNEIRDAKTGKVLDVAPIDNRGKALGTAQGTAIADAQNKLPGVETFADEALKNIDFLTDDKNNDKLDALTGWSGLVGRYVPGELKDVQSKIDQLMGGSFLQAMESLRGTGQITEIEGTKATDAIARLNQSQSLEGFKASLKDLRSVLDEIRQNMRNRAGGIVPPTAGTGTPQAGPNQTISDEDLLKKYGVQ